ncbi:MAG: NAD(P)-binding domain-containing protein [Polyangia bacterium]
MSALLANFTYQLLSSQLLSVLALLGAGVGLAHYLARRREDRRARGKLAEAVQQKLDVPATLHPVIDPDVCIGSGSCLAACPEGRILGLVDGKAALVNASKCIGHGRCASECPVHAIRLVFGTAERGLDLPELDERFETARPGVHIVGELAGMGLIRNALVQGLQVAAHVRQSLAGGQRAEGAVDVAIVGAGPAGLAAAAGARAAGLSFALIEQDTVGGAVAHYPRQKLVMTEPVDLPYFGRFGRRLMSKEELIAAFGQLLERARIQVYERTKVTGIEGRADDFTVATTRGVLRARRVVLAIGRRGTPRRMGVAGEDAENVAYRLIDPRQYEGRRVLVVGGGDSALEAAIQLAGESRAEVSIAYRGPEFGRCRPANQKKLADLVARGRVRALMSTEVAAVEPDRVLLKTGDQTAPLQNDFVLACLGGELPTEFLKSVGVAIRRHHGDKAMPNPALGGRSGSRAPSWRVPLAMVAAGLVICAVLAAVGSDYYLLPRALRYRDPRHALLKPSGAWGHGVGILATLFMLSNFAYSARKRLKMFKRSGPIAPWLRFHVFVGVMSPLTILFHSAWQWGNQLATATYVALIVVMATGLVGRFLYGLIRFDARDVERMTELRAQLRPVVERVATPEPFSYRPVLAPLMLWLEHGFGAALWWNVSVARVPRNAVALWRSLGSMRQLLLHPRAYARLRGDMFRLTWLRFRSQYHRPLKRVMTVWRVLHVASALVLIALIGLHVWVSLRVGFKWPGR